MEEDVSTFQKIKRWVLGWLKREWRKLLEWVREVELGVAWALAGLSLVSFIFTSIWYIDPALLTMVMQFQPATCTTIYSAELIGLKNCSWTSCRIGCTAELFKCWHILVNYTLVSGSQPIPPPWSSISSLSTPSVSLSVEPRPGDEKEDAFLQNTQPTLAKLFPNVKGCGYPPRLNCQDFFLSYGSPNSSFPCWVSHLDPQFALTEINLKRLKEEVTFSLIPLATFIIFILYALCRLGIFSLCNPLRCCPSPPESMDKIRLTPSQLHRYKRALHAKKRELEKQREEKSIENKIDNSNEEEINLREGLDALEKVGHIQTTSNNEKNQGESGGGERKLSWDFGNVENLPGCSSALENLENIHHQVGKKKE